MVRPDHLSPYGSTGPKYTAQVLPGGVELLGPAASRLDYMALIEQTPPPAILGQEAHLLKYP